MPRNPHPEGHASTTVPDGVRRAAADINLAARQLQHWMADPQYKPRMLTGPARKDLADVRDRITTLLGDHR